jgi:glyoxylase-like metal-dependent hydrolase (beta-lactamase superfamily II)
MEIHPRISAIDVSGLGEIWIYVIRGQKIAMIDTGPKEPLPIAEDMNKNLDKDISPVLQFGPPELQKLGITLDDIDFILNTHIHFDHTAGNAAVKSVSNAQLLIHEDEAGYFEEPRQLFDREQAPIIEIMMGKEHLDEEFKRFINEDTGPGLYVAVDRRLKDNDTIDLGEGYNLKVIHLPGHTQGSVGYYWEEEGLLFAGDAIQGVCDHMGGLPIIDNLVAYEKSLERVKKLPLKVMLNSHPFRGLTIPNSNIMIDMEIKQFIEESQEFSRKLRDAAKDVAQDFQKKPFSELYDEVIRRFPKEAGLKPLNQIGKQFFSPATLLNYMNKL